jgi:hypothetical protein
MGATVDITEYLISASTPMLRASRMLERVMNLEKQTEEFKAAIDEFDKDIRRHSEEGYKLGFEESKPNPED